MHTCGVRSLTGTAGRRAFARAPQAATHQQQAGDTQRRPRPRSPRRRGRPATMQLVSNALAQECAMGALMVGYFMTYYESYILPPIMRQEKKQYK